MKRSVILALIFCSAVLTTSKDDVRAQDVHFTQFDASPLLLNPANTGAFNGEYRASAIYRDQWRSVVGSAAFKTYAVSFDMPVIRDISVDDYLAAGVQLYNDVAGDGNLSNFSGMLSVAYHKFLGQDARRVLTVGLQGGYSKKNLDLSKLYFGDEFIEGQWLQGAANGNRNWLTTGTSSYLINAGISYAQALSDNVGINVGIGVNNINQPLESFDMRNRSAEVGLGMRYSGQAGAIIGLSERFSLKPAVLVQSQTTAMEIIGGNEFHYKLGEDYDVPTATALFAGAWYRHQDAILATIGVEFKGFRIGFGYDYNISDLRNASNGNGGFEVSVRYVAPSPLDFARKLLYPCSRF